METGTIILLAVLAAILLAVRWCIRTVNGFKAKEIRVEESLSGVEVALTKRYDLMTKLLDVVKGYMGHESGLFTQITKLRRGMSIEELNEVKEQLDSLSDKILAVAENYPQMRSGDIFLELQRAIRDAEEHLQAARRLYNTNVTSYNTAISMFPAKLLAKDRRPKVFFAAEEQKRAYVTMEFES
ncbi:MAG: LemA family protein [Clostridia bacterium]|nr:LemA family protein [Clostridia bacterium]